MIPIKSEQEIGMIGKSARILSQVIQKLKESVKPGISTLEIDAMAADLISGESAVAAFKNYKGFPANVCISLNEEVVHGIPGGRLVKDGDIVSLDAGVNFRGYFSDAAVTFPVGKVDAGRQRLIEVTRKALYLGIEQARENNYLSDISHAIQEYVEANGFSVVRQFVGHGIGLKMHEEPEIPNFGKPRQGPRLAAGMVLAIEPMVNMGTWEVDILDNGWTAVTKDRLPSAHFEHTVAITRAQALVLSRLPDEALN
jgi:methionyl aminopeptidase